MDHNEIAAVYRAILTALGLNPDTFEGAEIRFWDEHIYDFAATWEHHDIDHIRAPMLLDIVYNFYEINFQEDVNG